MARQYIQKMLERIGISLSVILCMQLPFFIVQYTHQLICSKYGANLGEI